MRKFIFSLIFALAGMAVNASVYEGTCGENLTWRLDGSIMTVSGTGDMTNWSSEYDIPWYDEKNEIRMVVIEEGVTSVGHYAFKGCSTIQSISLPESLVQIGDYAFRNASITDLTIPSNVSSIGQWTFYDCDYLTHVKCLPTTPPTLNGNLCNTYSGTMEIPCGTQMAYNSAPYWTRLFSSYDWSIEEFMYLPYEIRFEVSDPALGHIEILEEWNCTFGYAKAKVVPNQKVRFDGWDNGATDPTYKIYPTSDTTVVAKLVEDDTQFTVIVTADESKGTVSGSGTYYYGDEMIIHATAKEGYTFQGWSDGNMQNPRVLPYANHQLEALFRECRILNSEGTDFWVTFLRSDNNNSFNNPLSLSLTFAALEPCVVTIENPYMGWYEQYVLAAGVTRRVDMDENLCYSYVTDSILHTGLHITSTKNVSVFAANYRIKTFDVANVLPCSDLKDEYYIQTYPASDHTRQPQGTHFAIVATEDSTIVDYMVTAQVESSIASEPNVPYSTPVLNAGEVYYIWTGLNDGYASDLSGSHVQARDGKKIAVFQGAPHTNIPYMVRDRDNLYSQAVPVTAWGNEFVVPSSLHHKRDIVRVMALEDGTQVYVNNQLVHTFEFINGDENDRKRTFEFELGESNVYGEIGDHVMDRLPEPLVVDSSCYITTSAPTSVHLFMTSNRYDNYSQNTSETGINDPAMLYIAPVEQMVKEACFSTYNTQQIKLHYINIIARTDATDDIVLKGNGQLRPLANEFRQINSNSDYAFARVQIEDDVYTLSGSKGFIAYVYGFGERESYAFSVGGKNVYQQPKMKLILSCDSIMGSVFGAGEYDFNEIVEISATANEGYEFVHWTDGEENAVRQIIMDDDKELTALFREIGKEPVDTVEVIPTDNSADMLWPEVPFAYSYCITIWLDAFHTQIYCKLYFNAYGMLIDIIFYSSFSNNGPRRAPSDMVKSMIDFAFSLYGLEPETTYYYTITAYDEEGNILNMKEGSFTTMKDQTGIEEVSENPSVTKFFKDGQIYIFRDDKIYTVQGQQINQ